MRPAVVRAASAPSPVPQMSEWMCLSHGPRGTFLFLMLDGVVYLAIWMFTGLVLPTLALNMIMCWWWVCPLPQGPCRRGPRAHATGDCRGRVPRGTREDGEGGGLRSAICRTFPAMFPPLPFARPPGVRVGALCVPCADLLPLGAAGGLVTTPLFSRQLFRIAHDFPQFPVFPPQFAVREGGICVCVWGGGSRNTAFHSGAHPTHGPLLPEASQPSAPRTVPRGRGRGRKGAGGGGGGDCLRPPSPRRWTPPPPVPHAMGRRGGSRVLAAQSHGGGGGALRGSHGPSHHLHQRTLSLSPTPF